LRPNCELRTSSTSAPQSLMMLNDPFVIRQVAGLAARISKEAGASLERRFQLAWKLVFGRQPNKTERREGIQFLRQQAEAAQSKSSAKTDPGLIALSHLCQALVGSNGFLYVD